MDKTKNKYELPRFPINEKYGEIKRFKRLLKTIPFPYKKITPLEKYIKDNKNQDINKKTLKGLFIRENREYLFQIRLSVFLKN